MLSYLSTEVKQDWKQYGLKQYSSAHVSSEMYSAVLQRISNGLSLCLLSEMESGSPAKTPFPSYFSSFAPNKSRSLHSLVCLFLGHALPKLHTAASFPQRSIPCVPSCPDQCSNSIFTTAISKAGVTESQGTSFCLNVTRYT